MSRLTIIFGGARGIGAAVARAFAAAGDTVVIAARTARDVKHLAQEIGAQGFACDVSDPEAVEAVFSAIAPPDVVINAAAIQGGRGGIGPIWETDPARFSQVIDINLVGAYNVTRSALLRMRPRGRGSLVMFSGGGSTGPRPGFSGLCGEQDRRSAAGGEHSGRVGCGWIAGADLRPGARGGGHGHDPRGAGKCRPGSGRDQQRAGHFGRPGRGSASDGCGSLPIYDLAAGRPPSRAPGTCARELPGVCGAQPGR